MATFTKRVNFLESLEGNAVREKLQIIADDILYNTPSSYNTNSDLFPDNQISFVEKHMNYLQNHPKVDPGMYLANIRLMTRIR